MAGNAWLWFYVAVMAGGALLFLSWSRDPRGVPMFEYAIAIFIPVWSGLAYLAMALGQGSIEVDGRTVHVARYLDWVVTTPLLLVALAGTAMYHVKKDWTLIGTLIGADVVMILSGLIADLTGREVVQWLWFTIGCLCLGVILLIVWGPLVRIADEQGPQLGAAYRRVAGFLTILWFGYPTVWALGPAGIGLIGPSTDVALFVLLPILSKVGFSFLDLTELRKLGPTGEADKHPARHAWS